MSTTTQIKKHHVGRRMLVTNSFSGISAFEVRLLEVSPSGIRAKFKNLEIGNEFWSNIGDYDYRILELLPEKKQRKRR